MLLKVLHPRLLGFHVLAVVLTAIAGWLGLWQLDAWEQHRAAEARDLTQAAPVPLASVMGPDDPFPAPRVGQPVTVSGTWVPSATVYVEGREREGVIGYWAVTPVAVGSAPDAPALLVVRGWTPTPSAPAVSGPVSLTGWLQPTEGTGAVDTSPGDDVLPQLRIADAIQHIDQDLYGAYAIATQPVGDLEAADLEQLPSAGTFTALRNLLYALEWWFFGGFVVFIWWRWLRDDVLADPAAGLTGDAGDPS